MRTFHPILMALALLISGHAFAGDASGKVLKIYVLACPSASSQADCAVAIVRLTNAAINAPACSTSGSSGLEWAFWVNTPAGKAMFSTLLHAQAVKANVAIIGDNTCGGWGDRERPSYVYVDYPQ
jgi:hypothetical protein